MARDKHRRSSSLSPAPDRKEKRRRSRSRDRDRRQKERKRSRSRDRDKKRTRSRSRDRKERKRDKDSRGRDTHSRGDSQEEDAGGDPRVSDRWKLGDSHICYLLSTATCTWSLKDIFCFCTLHWCTVKKFHSLESGDRMS